MQTRAYCYCESSCVTQRMVKCSVAECKAEAFKEVCCVRSTRSFVRFRWNLVCSLLFLLFFLGHSVFVFECIVVQRCLHACCVLACLVVHCSFNSRCSTFSFTKQCFLFSSAMLIAECLCCDGRGSVLTTTALKALQNPLLLPLVHPLSLSLFFLSLCSVLVLCLLVCVCCSYACF